MRAAGLLPTFQNPMRVVDGAAFDGTNDFMTRGGLVGAADSKKGILSCWLRLDGGDGTDMALVNGQESGAEYFILQRTSGNAFRFLVGGSSQVAWEGGATGTYTASATWLHLLVSWDVAVAGARHFYVNDIDKTFEGAFVDRTIDYTLTDWSIGALANSPNVFRLNGCLAEVYIAPGQYLDFSLVANRRKFISASGKPMHLGTTGSLPTGTAPLVYLHLDDGEAAANFATNRGTGGDFTITGALATGSSSPSD